MEKNITTASSQPILQRVMFHFAISLLLMTIGMGIGALFIPPMIASLCMLFCMVLLIGTLIFKWIATRRDGEPRYLSMNFVYAFTGLMGVGLYPVIMSYAQTIGANLTMGAVGITFVLFFSLAIYAQKTERNFLDLGSVLMMALIGLILVSILGLFIHATALQLMIAVAGVLIFSFYVIYDIQLVMSRYMSEEMIPWMVLDLFLDFINLLLYILRIFGISFSRD